MKCLPKRVVTLMLLACCAPWSGQLAAADVYRWTDADGRVHYGARPPAEASAKRIDVPDESRPAVDGDVAKRRERQNKVLESYSYERERRKAERAEAAKQDSERARRCQQLRAEWRRLSLAVPVYFKRDDGSREYLSDERREQYKAQLRPSYAEACGEPPQ